MDANKKKDRVNELGDIKVRADFSRFVFTSIVDQIRQTDTKAYGVLGILGILTSLLFNRLGAMRSSIGTNLTWWIIVVISALLFILVLGSVIGIVYPRLSKKNKESILYFGDISKHSKEEYLNKAMDYSAEDVIEEAYKQSYSIAVIANKKFTALRIAMINLVITFIWTFIILSL